jgi:predicted transcriptional regulator
MQDAWPDIALIRKKRKELHLTQQKLAELSGVPQSVISKIEDGKIGDPSYSNVKHIFQSLLASTANDASQPHASELMNPNVISVKPTDRIKEAWHKMRKKNVSQLPVIDDSGRIVGGLHETDLMLEDEVKQVKDLMRDSFPIVGMKTRVSTLASFIRAEHAVLVVNRGKLVGIITAYDLIENAYGKYPGAVK